MLSSSESVREQEKAAKTSFAFQHVMCGYTVCGVVHALSSSSSPSSSLFSYIIDSQGM